MAEFYDLEVGDRIAIDRSLYTTKDYVISTVERVTATQIKVAGHTRYFCKEDGREIKKSERSERFDTKLNLCRVTPEVEETVNRRKAIALIHQAHSSGFKCISTDNLMAIASILQKQNNQK